MQRKILTVVATWAVLASVAASPSSAVVGGSDAAPGEFPSVAQIQFGTPLLWFNCTGTLIDSTHVLSAGHCASVTGEVGSPAGWPPQAVSVWIGGTKSEQGESVPVKSVSVSPDYLGLSRRNDIAILELARASAMSPTQVAGAGERSSWDPGDLATVAGWGVTEEDAEDVTDTLQKAQVPITTDAYCREAYGESDGVLGGFDGQTMVCAGYPQGGIDTCYGDSGGPLFGRTDGGARRVVGVTSWGNGCAQEGYPGVYARVADTKLRTWVASQAPGGVSSGTSTAGTGGGKSRKSKSRSSRQRKVGI